MKKSVKYVLTEQEYDELKYKLGLLEDSVRTERNRLNCVERKTDSEVISKNNAEYHMSLIRDITRLAL